MSIRDVRNFLSLAMVFGLAGILVMIPSHARSEDAQAAREIRVDNFSFSPENLTVPINATITWVNKDDVPHVIASNDGVFKSKALDTDDKYSYTFTRAGTYPYYCSIHPKMVGKIIVQ